MNTESIKYASPEMHKNLEEYSCQFCGAKLVLDIYEPVIYCGHCRGAYVSTTFYGVEKYVAPAKISDDEAWEKIKRWFRHKGGAKDLETHAKLSALQTVYIPFWKTVTEVRVVVCGYNVRTDSDGNESHDLVKYMYKNSYPWNSIACDQSEYGLFTYDTDVDAKPILELERSIPLVPVTLSETDAKDISYEDVTGRAKDDAMSKMDECTFCQVFLKIKSFKLIYLPYLQVSYNYKGKEYSVVMNGISGNIEVGNMPGDRGRQANGFGFRLGAGSAVMGVGAGVAIVFIISGSVLGAIIGLIVGGILAAWGYSYYEKSLHILQYGSEVRTGDQITEVVTANEVN
ncbi:hypothetical protein [Methanosarcina sp. UBA289]|uniref:hypothetical protein n=1 Tax=Methanosarcina sp. UBA289 TaxID=1915574 RepID=UPI0025E600EF|nr:hypothetical protein [Methanosarcina sp. UBA289]